MKAVWKNKVIAESDDTIVVEGNHYFPPKSIKKDHFIPSDYTTVCSWKGTAKYYDIVVDDQINENAAWFYQSPSEKAVNIKDRIAFWKGVEIVE